MVVQFLHLCIVAAKSSQLHRHVYFIRYHPCVPKNIPNPDTPLPNGWEQRTTSNGKHYYVDHLTKTTHFSHPGLIEQVSKTSVAPLIQAADPEQTLQEPVAIGGTERTEQIHNTESVQLETCSSIGGKETQRAQPQHTSKPVKSLMILPEKPEKIDIMVKLKQLRIQLQLLQPVTGHCRLQITRDDVFEVFPSILRSRL